MWRALFLVCVVVGALALALGAVVGLGLMKASAARDGDGVGPPGAGPPAVDPPAAAPPAGVAPAAGPATSPASRPATSPSSAPSAAAAAQGAAQGAAVVLRGADATLHGATIRQRPPEGDLTSWTEPGDYATWSVELPAGRYHVDLTRANAANSGGPFRLEVGPGNADPADDVLAEPRASLDGTATPTGGWDAFRAERLGTVELGAERTLLVLRPAGRPRTALMRLRQVALVPADPPAVAGR